MTEALAWLEGSSLGEAVRGAGVWAYGIVNLLHILGIATLFGSVLGLDLSLLGRFRRVPVSMIAIPAVPLAAAGFALAAVSGLCLLATNASEYAGNPFFAVKFGAILAGLLNVALLHRSPAWQAARRDAATPAQRRRLALAGGLSLVAWTTAVAAGRMTGYW